MEAITKNVNYVDHTEKKSVLVHDHTKVPGVNLEGKYFECKALQCVMTVDCCEDRRKRAHTVKPGDFKQVHLSTCKKCPNWKEWNSVEIDMQSFESAIVEAYKVPPPLIMKAHVYEKKDG